MNNKNLPILLSAIASIGVVGTAVSAVAATPKAIKKIESDEVETKKDIVKSAWKYYIPSALIGCATIGCIAGSTCMSSKSQATLASAYALARESYDTYTKKVRDIYGEKAHNEIINSIVAEQAKDVEISSPGFLGPVSVDFSHINDSEVRRLFYDAYSKRYFESTLNRVLQGEYHINRNYTLGADVCVNDFYEFLGLKYVENGNDLTWVGYYDDGINWIDFNHKVKVLDDGTEVLVIEMVYPPFAYTLDDN